ncbi:MAG: hypothetical protein V1856_00300 [Candidatus Liptonbacteria bacterium]
MARGMWRDLVTTLVTLSVSGGYFIWMGAPIEVVGVAFAVGIFGAALFFFVEWAGDSRANLLDGEEGTGRLREFHPTLPPSAEEKIHRAVRGRKPH